MEKCLNHPDRESLSTCRGCGGFFCHECLVEGKEYYYCKKVECQKLLPGESAPKLMPEEIVCPNCTFNIVLSADEIRSRKIHCPECESFLDYSVDPPKVLNALTYTELLTSLNQGDIALIKSILDDAKIDYHVDGERFLGVQPFSLPVRFSVESSQLDEARELLKDFKLHIFGASTSTGEEK